MAPDTVNTPNKDSGVVEVAVNGRRYRLPKRPTVVVCIDGSSPATSSAPSSRPRAVVRQRC
jgi:hypothetical protein